MERFDRAWMDGGQWIARLPQEDFCQALGYPPDQKYEKDGGPGMEACLRLLDGSADAEVDRLSFQLTQLAFWLMAASDGHAKNYSLFLQQGDAYAMTPLYDVISVWPYIGDGANQFRWRSAGLAMALRARNAHYALPLHPHPALARAGDEERRPADVAGHARHDRSGRRGARRRRVTTAAVVSGPNLGHHSGGSAVTGARVHRRPERTRARLETSAVEARKSSLQYPAIRAGV